MPRPSTITPQMQRVREIADQALQLSEGITVWFRAEQYGSHNAAKTAMIGYQSAFSSMRTRARRLTQSQSHEAQYLLDGFVKGPYDKLACMRQEIEPNGGWKLVFTPNSSLGVDLEITDNATGKPLEAEDPMLNRCVAIGNKFLNEDSLRRRENRPFVNPLTDDEMRFVWHNRPDVAEIYGFTVEFVAERRNVSVASLMSYTEEASSPRSTGDYASVDINDLSEEELMDMGDGAPTALASEGENS